MANQITDNRTLVHAADAVAPYDDLSGAAAGTLDTEIKIQNTGSIGEYLTSTRAGLLYDAGSAQNWANNVFYIWINCGIVGLLDTKANGGFTIRFCGATVTDWFEVYVAGSDDWPPAIQGGWTQFVVDIETARSTAVTNNWTNGTVPATSAIRYVGWSGITAGTMPRMVDNTWMDEIRRLPDGSPGIIVEGRNGGTTDWDSADIYAQLTDSVGTFVPSAGGAWKVNTPVQFGINDTSTHGFTDTNTTWLWDDQEFMPDDVYSISALGNSGGTTNVTFGVKTGTGDDATGAQGASIQASAGGARWSMDFDDPNLDSIKLHGCQFIHGDSFQLDDPAVSCISTFFVDCTSARVDNATDFLRCSIINANTADGVAFMTTDDLSDVKFCNFEFSDGHAVELTTPRVATQASKGNVFTGYGANTTNDAAIYNNAGGAVTINVTDGGNLATYRNGTSATTTVNASVSVNFEVLDQNGDPIQSARVSAYLQSDDTEVINTTTNASGIASTTYSGTTPADIYFRIRKSSTGALKYVNDSGIGTIESGTGFSVTRTLRSDPIADPSI